MVKHIKKVTKRRPTRERKRIIVVGAEGNNKSEIQYFHELEKKQNKYHFILAPGKATDPERIVRKTANKAKQENLDYNFDLSISIPILYVVRYLSLQYCLTIPLYSGHVRRYLLDIHLHEHQVYSVRFLVWQL